MTEKLSKKNFELYYESITDAGKQKALNEDRVLTLTMEYENQVYGLFAVADGVGGTEKGECASQMAKEYLEAWFENELRKHLEHKYSFDDICDELLKKIEMLNKDIFYRAGAEAKSMASTLSLLFVYQGMFKVFHIGDSRIYRFRHGRLEQLTKDDSWVMQEIDAGRLNPEEAKIHPRRHIITGALGAKEDCSIYEYMGEIDTADVFLICSDGYYEYIEQGDLEYLYSDIERKELRHALEGTLELICRGRAHDNISAVLIMIGEKKRKSIWRKG